MRILHIVSSMNPETGGVCKAIRITVLGLTGLGVVSEVVCTDEADAEFLLSDAFKIYAVGGRISSWNYSLELMKWLSVNLKNYDVIIVHGLWQYQSYAVYKVWNKIRTNRPKLFVMPHGMLDPYFQQAPERKWKAIRNRILWKIVERKIVNNSTGLLFTCEEEKILARSTFFPYIPKKEQVVGLGIERPPFFNQEMEVAFKKKMNTPVQSFLLFIGRIDKKKGIDLLVNAYIKLSITGVKLPQVVIAGPGMETEYGKSIVELARHYKDIVFSGMLDGDAKWGAFYCSEAFMLTSHQENFGISVVEALACGKAVLISNKINIWREILKEESGYVEEDSLLGGEKLLLQWVQLNADAKKKIGLNANNCFLKNFTIERATEKMYKALCGA